MRIIKGLKLWPCLGVFGLRQVGKTTLLKSLLPDTNVVSLDKESEVNSARLSASVYLARQPRPLIIDEVQKAPGLFDEIKGIVDEKRIPGQFIMTGSASFQSKDQARESLTGRIGTFYLYPMNLAEAHHKKLSPERTTPIHQQAPRFPIREFMQSLETGGLPIPMFLRSTDERNQYWESWS